MHSRPPARTHAREYAASRCERAGPATNLAATLEQLKADDHEGADAPGNLPMM
jgi:hypothetical protein